MSATTKPIRFVRSVEWKSVELEMPDSDLLVLIAIEINGDDLDPTPDVAYYDGECWVYASGAPVKLPVAFWADFPEVPRQSLRSDRGL